MIKIYKNSVQDRKLRPIKNYAANSWVCVTSPTGGEITEIRKRFNITQETIQDCLDNFELPRIKIENNNLLVILRAPVKKGGEYYTTPLTIILNERNIVTIALEELDIIDDLRRQRVEIFTTQKSNFLINISLGVINYFNRYISLLHKEVQTKKRNIKNIDKHDVFLLVELEEVLNNFMSSLIPNVNIIKKILTYNYIDLYQKDKDLINDLLVDGEQVIDLCKTTLKTISNIRDGYSTVLSIRLNQIMQFLTYLTGFLTIPMVISGIYGMNIELPLAHNPDAFWILAFVNVLIMALALLTFVIFKKKL